MNEREDTYIAKPDEDGAPAAQGGGSLGGNDRFDPLSIFKGIDADKDGQVTEKELEGNRMSDRRKKLIVRLMRLPMFCFVFGTSCC